MSPCLLWSAWRAVARWREKRGSRLASPPERDWASSLPWFAHAYEISN